MQNVNVTYPSTTESETHEHQARVLIQHTDDNVQTDIRYTSYRIVYSVMKTAIEQ